MAGAIIPVIEGTYTVVEGTALATGARAAFSTLARPIGSALGSVFKSAWNAINILAGGKAVYDVATGESASPTPLPGSGGGGSGGGIIPSSTAGGGLPVPRGNNLPVTVSRSTVPATTVRTMPVSSSKSGLSAVVINTGKTKLPNIIPAQSTNALKQPTVTINGGTQTALAGVTAGASIGSLIDEATANPWKSVGVALGVAAVAVVAYGIVKR